MKNIGHSSLRGVSIVKKTGRPCAQYRNYYFWKIIDYGIYTQAKGSELRIHSNVFVDATVSITNLVVGNGFPLKHEHGDMKISIDNNILIGISEYHTCEDYITKTNASIVTSGLTNENRALHNDRDGVTATVVNK